MKNIILLFTFLFPATLSAQTLQSHSTTYAVVVGISDYQDEGIPDLRFADKDAEAFANFLRSPAGGSLDHDQLQLLTNEQATGAQIAINLDWLIDVTHEGDRVIIYYSGHGDVESKRISQPGYLLGWDAPFRVYAAGGAMNIRDLQDIISTLSVINKAKVMVIMDACRSGKLSGSDIDGARLTSQNLARQFENEIKILSCQPNEYSIEGEQWGDGRGAFSYHLLDGLYGMADTNEDMSVNLIEIRGYLEQNVSREVAPHSQLPMTVGNGRERLVDVVPELLALVKEDKKGQMQLFRATEQRGLEDEVLADLSASGAEADSNIVKIYYAFHRALRDKIFLEPEDACADVYYEQLIREPKLERLHNSMRRNYAAALQDDAQQVMNTMLKSGLTQQILKAANAKNIYKYYPAYLDRAAELLGKQHYMYPVLQARKLFFEGQIETNRKVKLSFYQKALKIQPDMAHAMVQTIRNYKAEQADSAQYYFQRSTELIPSWVEPYLAMASFYEFKLKKLEKAAEMLDLAEQVDSTSVLVWYKKANFYKRHKKYEAAEHWFLKTINSITADICFPCANANLGVVYMDQGRYTEAENLYKEIIQIDSTFVRSFYRLGLINVHFDRYTVAETYFKKAIQIDSTFWMAYRNLGLLKQDQQLWKEALTIIQKAIEIWPRSSLFIAIQGNSYTHLGRLDEAKVALDKALEMNANDPDSYIYLAQWCLKKERLDMAWDSLEEGLKKGLGNGRLDRNYLETQADFEAMRNDPKWDELVEKYFSEQQKE